MPNAYLELKNKHEQEFNDFPIAFAFNEKQFLDGLKKLGFEPSDDKKVLQISGGGFIRKSDRDLFSDMLDRHEKEMKTSIEQDEKGDGFVLDMFTYELANHEYGITYDPQDTLNALGMTTSDVLGDIKLWNAFKKAKNEVIKNTCM